MYAGMGSEALALVWLIRAVRIVEPGVDLPEIEDEILTWYSAHNKGALQRHVLSSFGKDRPRHLFLDILDRHCPEARADLDKVKWPQTCCNHGEPKHKRKRRPQQLVSSTPIPPAATGPRLLTQKRETSRRRWPLWGRAK